MTGIPSPIQAAIDDARRGHRVHEYEGAALRLAEAVEEHFQTQPRPIEYRTVRRLVLSDMQAEVTAWCERKGWKGEGSAPVTFGDTMALLHSEVSEALEAFRDWGTADATDQRMHVAACPVKTLGDVASSVPCPECGALPKPEGVGSEFADILIRLLDDCDRWGVDLAAEYERKMAYNETRAFQHGGRTL